MWFWLEATGSERSGWKAEMSYGNAGWEGGVAREG